MKTQSPVRTLAQAGLIAAMYAALTLLLPAPSFGIGQCRISEMLTILAVFTPSAIPGLAVGCLVSNLVGLGMGANPAGAWDLLFGPLATLAAALLTWRLRNLRVKGVPVLASLPPVVINAVVVGLELTLVSPVFTPQVLAINMLSVGIGQLLACTVCGLLLHAALERSGASLRPPRPYLITQLSGAAAGFLRRMAPVFHLCQSGRRRRWTCMKPLQGGRL